MVGLVLWLGRGHESTDDAQIEGRITQISTRVGGPILELHVTDNQFVEKGTVLARIDPREYQVAVDRAAAELADAEANAQAAGAGVPIASVSTSSDLRTASGGVDEARGRHCRGRPAGGGRPGAAAGRPRRGPASGRPPPAAPRATSSGCKPLVEKEEIAQQQFERRVATADAARAAVEAAESESASPPGPRWPSPNSARCRRASLPTRARGGARRREDRAGAAAGDAGARGGGRGARQAGDRGAGAGAAQSRPHRDQGAERRHRRQAVHGAGPAGAGRPAALRPGLARRCLGRRQLQGDAAGRRCGPARPPTSRSMPWTASTFRGKVDSIGAATGAKFSLLPPENATGNYVKVVQRVPVKIVLDPGQDEDHQLRPGLSVAPTVYTK